MEQVDRQFRFMIKRDSLPTQDIHTDSELQTPEDFVKAVTQMEWLIHAQDYVDEGEYVTLIFYVRDIVDECYALRIKKEDIQKYPGLI